jgi:hypothetical protein
MEKIETTATLTEAPKKDFQQLLNVDFKKIDNPLLAKLIEEVRHEEALVEVSLYNRFHNRHNRS